MRTFTQGLESEGPTRSGRIFAASLLPPVLHSEAELGPHARAHSIRSSCGSSARKRALMRNLWDARSVGRVDGSTPSLSSPHGSARKSISPFIIETPAAGLGGEETVQEGERVTAWD